MSRILLVLAHPRRTSLTGQVADRFAGVLARRGHDVEFADLTAERFDPVLGPGDEPDWADPGKRYSAGVEAEMARIRRNNATVMVFPVWWWSMPALLKGWIDRVWNHGFAYGDHAFPHARVWMLGVAGNTAESFAKHGCDQAMQVQLDGGILGYCRIRDRRLELLHGAIEGGDYPARILARAETLAEEF